MSDEPNAHVCVYVGEGEMHIDVRGPAPSYTTEEIAQVIAEAVYEAVVQFYAEVEKHANSRPAQLQ